MRRMVLVLIFVLPLLGVVSLQAQTRDEQAIRALLDRALQANSSVDEKIAKQALADHSSTGGPFFPPFVNSVASVGDLDSLVGQLLGQLTARSVTTTGPVNVRVDKNLAWATFTWRAELTFKDGTRRGFDGRTTATFIREGKGWKFAHWHNSLPAQLPPSGAALQAEAQVILQIVRNAWEAMKSKQAATLTDYFADDASVFDESQAYRLRGKADIMRQVEAWLQMTELRSYQMLDPQVQVFGDTALLTYYFSELGVSGGKEFSTAGKVSTVFVKQGGVWRAMHEHVSVNR